MQLTKTWFYKMVEIGDENIEIWDNLNIVIFDDWNCSKKIEIWENSKVEIYWYLSNINEFNLDIYLKKENSNLKLGYLLLNIDEEELNSKISCKILWNNSASEMKIISIVWNNSKINFNWIIDINDWITWIVWNLIEENYFIWQNSKINFIPSLFVKSNEVKAKHSCKIEKINDEKLFYLVSRWIVRETAIVMMLESYIKTLFKCFVMIDNVFYQNLIFEILTKIKNKNFIY